MLVVDVKIVSHRQSSLTTRFSAAGFFSTWINLQTRLVRYQIENSIKLMKNETTRRKKKSSVDVLWNSFGSLRAIEFNHVMTRDENRMKTATLSWWLRYLKATLVIHILAEWSQGRHLIIQQRKWIDVLSKDESNRDGTTGWKIFSICLVVLLV